MLQPSVCFGRGLQHGSVVATCVHNKNGTVKVTVKPRVKFVFHRVEKRHTEQCSVCFGGGNKTIPTEKGEFECMLQPCVCFGGRVCNMAFALLHL
jgi:hypothetical protein